MQYILVKLVTEAQLLLEFRYFPLVSEVDSGGIQEESGRGLQFVQQQIGKIRSPILLLVDEAHNFGANNLKRLLTSRYDYRLALSATIDRHGDPEGTQKLYDYFGDKCIEYTLKDAIDNGGIAVWCVGIEILGAG